MLSSGLLLRLLTLLLLYSLEYSQITSHPYCSYLKSDCIYYPLICGLSQTCETSCVMEHLRMQLPALDFFSPELETFHASWLFPFPQWSLQHHNLPVKYSIEYELKCPHFSCQQHLTALPQQIELAQVKWLFTHVENEVVVYICGQMVTPVSVESQESNNMDPLILILHTAP